MKKGAEKLYPRMLVLSIGIRQWKDIYFMGPINSRHTEVYVGLASQNPRLETNSWKNFQVVLVSVFSTSTIANPGVSGGVEEVSGSIIEIVQGPYVFDLGKLAFGKRWAEEFLKPFECVSLYRLWR